MIEKIIINELSIALDVPVVVERAGRVAPFVLIERTGSNKQNRINAVTFAFQSYGSTLLEAGELNERVKEAVENLRGLDSVSAVRFARDYNFTDATTKNYRYQALFDIYY